MLFHGLLLTSGDDVHLMSIAVRLWRNVNALDARTSLSFKRYLLKKRSEIPNPTGWSAAVTSDLVNKVKVCLICGGWYFALMYTECISWKWKYIWCWFRCLMMDLSRELWMLLNLERNSAVTPVVFSFTFPCIWLSSVDISTANEMLADWRCPTSRDSLWHQTSHMFGAGRVCQDREPGEWRSSRTRSNMHGCVILGEMTCTGPGHGALLESIWAQAVGLRLASAWLVLYYTWAELPSVRAPRDTN